VLAGEATAIPKARDGVVEAIRVLQVARASAVKARTQVANQLKALIVTAPDALGQALRPLPTEERVARCAQLPRRWQALDRESHELDADLAELTQQAAPRLLAEPGVGPGCAARLLVAAGDNPTRRRNDAALAALCGASPVEASSGSAAAGEGAQDDEQGQRLDRLRRRRGRVRQRAGQPEGDAGDDQHPSVATNA
jgi:transposase